MSQIELDKYQQESRLDVLNQLVNIRTQLEKNLNENFSVVEGIGSYISAYQNVSDDSFRIIARELLYDKPCIRRITLVRNGEIVSMYPLPQQKEVIGPNTMVNSVESKQAFIDAKKFRKTVTVGPFSFERGGSVMIAYYPIFLTPPGGEQKSGRFWGFVGIIIDIPILMQISGLNDENMPIDFVLRGENGLADKDGVIYGDLTILMKEPVIISVSLPIETWRLEAIPKDGWKVSSPDFWRVQALGGFLVLCCAFLSLGIYWYILVRRRAEIKISETSSLLKATIESTVDAILVLAKDREVVIYNHKFIELFGLPENWSDLPESRQRIELVISKIRPDKEYLETLQETRTNPELFLKNVFELKDGRIIERVVQPFRLEGEVVGRLFNYRDITEQKRAEARLIESETNLLTLNQRLQIEKERLRRISITDDLTQIFNRRYIFHCLEREINKVHRFHNPLTIIMMDIDHFKLINDQFGHTTGDRVLQTVCKVISENIREVDFLGRYGGEEFLAVLPDCALNNGYLVAERIRKEIGDLTWHDPGLHLTISGGVAEYQGENITGFIRRVDSLLYEAKNNGRNQIKYDTNANEKVSS